MYVEKVHLSYYFFHDFQLEVASGRAGPSPARARARRAGPGFSFGPDKARESPTGPRKPDRPDKARQARRSPINPFSEKLVQVWV